MDAQGSSKFGIERHVERIVKRDRFVYVLTVKE